MRKIESKNALIPSLVIGIVSGILVLFFSFYAIRTLEIQNTQQERLKVMEQFLRFQTEAELTIKESIHLLEGYLAYIEVTPDLSEIDSSSYLDRLLQEKDTLIRNIGILENTTMIWNYPRQGNDSIIGTDFAQVELQKDDILRVKNQNEKIFIGPVDLLQGGTGFIVRMPINKNGTYWGQISIVLDAIKYMHYIESLAENAQLNIVVYNIADYPTSSIYGDEGILAREGLELNINLLDSTWRIATEPIDGWDESKPFFFALRILSSIFSLVIGTLMFLLLSTRSKIKQQANTDALTQLKNRHALGADLKQYKVTKKAESLIGIMFDINYFKQINDQFGHDSGDQVLKRFAKKLVELPYPKKQIYRLGGDEFLLFLISENSVPDIETLRKQLIFIHKNDTHTFEVVPSIGIASFPEEASDLEDVIKLSDQRMYADKDQNRTPAHL
ncbi:diguanylate cyclase [Gottschalkiaceae bacterium SANA]|nr:diguanylate cyclase [Gottschalkiaceae bacterium SANA]